MTISGSNAGDYKTVDASTFIPASIPTGGIIEAFPRQQVTLQTGTTVSAQMRRSGAVLLRAGQSIAALNMYIGSTGISASGASHYWMALINAVTADRLAVSDDKTTAAWSANTKKSFTLAYTATADIIVQAGLVVVGAAPTVPCMIGGNWQHLAEPPALGGITESGLTNPASCPSTLTTITSTGHSPFYWWAT